VRTRHLDSIRLRATIFRLMTIATVILPLVLAACGQNDDGGGGGPAY
jgi:hypothetical protein